MNNADHIEQDIKKLNFTTGPSLDERILAAATDRLVQTQTSPGKSSTASAGLWRKIMKSRITQLAAAAAVIVVVSLGLNQFTGTVHADNVTWADVTNRMAEVDYVHVYWLKSRGDIFKRHFEAWFTQDGQGHKKTVFHGSAGDMIYDDGQTSRGFDPQGKRTTKEPSRFGQGQTFFEVFTAGVWSEKNEQFNRQMSVHVGDDFLIYEFDPPADERQSLDRICITVGKNSHLPIQMKIYQKDSDDYDLVMFDYQADEPAPEFFEPPIGDVPNAQSEIVLDGPEVTMNIEGAPGLKQAIVHLYGKYDGPADQLPENYRKLLPQDFRKTYKKKGGPIFKLDVTFITDEGYRSGTNDIIVLWLNEAQQCGVGSANGGLDNWPDGQYRNIKFSPILRPIDKNNVYSLELSCWLQPK